MKKPVSPHTPAYTAFALISLMLVGVFFSGNNRQESPPLSQTPETMQASLILDTQARLGEGAFWNYLTQEFWWVDIEGRKFHRFHPSTGTNRTVDVGERIGTVVPTASGKHALVALQNGIHYLNLDTEQLTLLTHPEDSLPENRMNDGKCDPQGRLWVGSMHLKAKKGAAALYRIQAEGPPAKMVDSVTISNGIVWSADGSKMYYIDTPTRQVKQYAFNGADGTIALEKIAVSIPEGMGFPDGMAIDVEGNLWIALWGGFAVGCWNPQTGELLRKIEVPAEQVSSCAFGGPDLDMLYITTARLSQDSTKLAQWPHAGGLFAVKPGVKGVKSAFFAGEAKSETAGARD